MSHYDYRCNSCGNVWEENLPIDDRDVPLSLPCPTVNCSAPQIERIAAAPGVSYTYGGAKTPESFKDVLRNIKSKHHKSTIQV
jgi:putative FmdB family regulatory protein